MKLLVFLPLMLISTCISAQTKQFSYEDTLVFYQYVGGKPHMGRVQAEIEIAKKWGFKIENFFGDCGGTFDYKDEEFRIINQKSDPFFIKKYGENWWKRFEKEVESLLKEK